MHEWLQPFVIEITTFTASIPLIWQILVTAGWSAIPFIESDAGVAVAIAAGVPTIPAVIAAIIGNWVAVALVILGTDKIRNWLGVHTSKKSQEKRQGKVRRALEKYGVPGASLLGPLLIGTHLNAFFMAAAGVNRRYLLIWQTIAIVVWAIIFAVIMHTLMSSLRGYPTVD
ncbi:hypothetical protein D3C72_1778540 [compost metagenome]